MVEKQFLYFKLFVFDNVSRSYEKVHKIFQLMIFHQSRFHTVSFSTKGTYCSETLEGFDSKKQDQCAQDQCASVDFFGLSLWRYPETSIIKESIFILNKIWWLNFTILSLTAKAEGVFEYFKFLPFSGFPTGCWASLLKLKLPVACNLQDHLAISQKVLRTANGLSLNLENNI